MLPGPLDKWRTIAGLWPMILLQCVLCRHVVVAQQVQCATDSQRRLGLAHAVQVWRRERLEMEFVAKATVGCWKCSALGRLVGRFGQFVECVLVVGGRHTFGLLYSR